MDLFRFGGFADITSVSNLIKKEVWVMKRFLSLILCCVLILSTVSFSSFAFTDAKIYYVDSSASEDGNGLSAEHPFSSVDSLRSLSLNPGDSVLFKAGEVYTCDMLVLNCSGTKEEPIVISSYGDGDRPLLVTDKKVDMLLLKDCSYVTVSNFEIVAPVGGGIWIDTFNKESNGVKIDNIKFHNIQNTVATSRDNLSNGACAARACIMVKGLPAHSRYAVNNLTITNCEMYDCGNGISVWGSWNDEQKPWCDEEDIDPVFNKGVYISDCYFHDMDAEALIFGICDGAVCENCRCINCCQNDGINDDGTQFCNAAMWFWGSINSKIRYCEIAGQKTITDGMTCDFDSYTHYCTYEYIYSHDNARFVANCPQHSGHQGNTIRYCLSVNDNAVANNLSQNCYNSNEYGLKFYNNTIVNPGEIIIEGVRDGYICDNIFYGDFTSDFRSGRKKINDETGEAYKDIFDGVFKNNCFFGTCVPSCAKDNYICNPCFVGTDFSDPESFKLSSKSKLIGKGITVLNENTKDIYGNEISGSANIGCYAGTGEDNAQRQNIFVVIYKYISTFLGKAYQWIVDCNNLYWLF